MKSAIDKVNYLLFTGNFYDKSTHIGNFNWMDYIEMNILHHNKFLKWLRKLSSSQIQILDEQFYNLPREYQHQVICMLNFLLISENIKGD
jgi:hypothetical protein